MQERDTPVPVDVGGGRTGLPRPSADDCSAGTVSSQADLLETATGKGKSSLNRIGPKLGVECKELPKYDRIGSISSQLKSIRRNSWGGEPPRKRKVRDDSFEGVGDSVTPYKRKQDPAAFTLMEALDMITKYTRILDKLVGENPNTKKEIKETVSHLRKNAEVIGRITVQEWLEEHKWERIEKQIFDVDVQTDAVVEASSSVKDVGIQTMSVERINRELEEEKQTRRFREYIKMNRGSDKWKDIVNGDWSEGVYGSTWIPDRNLDWGDINEDIVLIVDANTCKDKGLVKKVTYSCPITKELFNRQLKAGEIEFGSENTQFEINGLEVQETGKRFIFVLPCDAVTAAVEMDGVYHILQSWGKLLRQLDRGNS